ncbi:MAG TPA: hypothetical protein VEA59_01095 [Patescibacteria group bacterium]|nr:hypothetical protein [Patescibacteria group bacterium]
MEQAVYEQLCEKLRETQDPRKVLDLAHQLVGNSPVLLGGLYITDNFLLTGWSTTKQDFLHEQVVCRVWLVKGPQGKIALCLPEKKDDIFVGVLVSYTKGVYSLNSLYGLTGAPVFYIRKGAPGNKPERVPKHVALIDLDFFRESGGSIYMTDAQKLAMIERFMA